jgi:cell division protein FtsZ
MESLIDEALENSAQEEAVRTDDEDFDQFGDPRIVVVGCGGAGNNTINRLHNIGIEGAETVAINTDKQHLDMIEADDKILVGSNLTDGLGAGGDPDVGKKATEKARATLKNKVLKDADLVFVTAGMGGGTGTGSAPVVANIAKDVGAIVVGMVSMPFRVERARVKKAEEGIDELSHHADSIIVLDNDRLLDYVPNLPIGDAFSVMDQIISETIRGISETITQPSLINLDYADMRSIMEEGGVAVMLVGESGDKDKTQVVEEALNHPLLDVDYRGASGSLVHITGGPDLSLTDANGIASKITERLDDDAKVIWGSRIQDDYKDKVRVMAIMTGVESSNIIGRDDNTQNTNSTSSQNSDNFTTDRSRKTSPDIDSIK